MKNYYLSMLVIALFTFTQTFAQSCPPNGFADSEDNLFFIYETGTSLCGDRPNTVTSEGSTFSLVFCDDTLSVYNLTAGSSLSDINNISVDFGPPIGICEYSGGTLSADDIEKIFKAMLKMYPNPITQGNDLNIKLGVNISVKVSIYSVTGKQMLTTNASNLSHVSIDISSLQNGIYIAQIVTDLATVTRKVIVMK